MSKHFYTYNINLVTKVDSHYIKYKISSIFLVILNYYT